jgi:hypothetical protein
MKDQNRGIRSSSAFAILRAVLPHGSGLGRSTQPKPVTVPAYQLPRHMHHNRAEIEGSDLCGCISCEQMFQKSEVPMWVAAGATAVCPRCDAAAVVGSGAGFQLTPELLHRAHLLLFEGMGLGTPKPRSRPADTAELTPLRSSDHSPVSA